MVNVLLAALYLIYHLRISLSPFIMAIMEFYVAIGSTAAGEWLDGYTMRYAEVCCCMIHMRVG
jgi:hypothetical protein